MLAGHITTTALLGNAVLSFDRHPKAAAAVRADRDLLPAAIEEVLRFRSPFPRLGRVTTTDTEIGGHAVPAGHLAFGHGIHFCIGAPLARLEAKITLGILLERCREIAVDTAGPIEFHNPWEMISVKRLPVLVA